MNNKDTECVFKVNHIHCVGVSLISLTILLFFFPKAGRFACLHSVVGVSL